MTTPLPLIDNCLFIDATAFERYTTCRRSFEYYFLRKRESSGRRPALEAGAILHTILECRGRLSHTTAIANIEKVQEQLAHLCYAGFDAAQPLSPELQAYLDTLHAPWTQMFPGYQPALDDFRTESFMIDTLRAYNKQYPTDPFEPLFDEDGLPLVELSFAARLCSFSIPTISPNPITIYWSGRLDLPTRWPDKTIWNVDYKTSTMDTGFDEYCNDQAQLGYLWALWKKTGIMPKGFMIDQILWRAPTKSGKGTEFRRHMESVVPERIEEWEENTIRIFEDILHDYARSYFPMETKWCKGKFGCCPYLDICKLPPQNRDVLLNSTFYKDVTWSPLRKV